ncbi:hypothetical protein GCM10012275_22420 [Longimycelium tulufanense]|uniref:Acyl carrier protein n=1 Tax=Longimycelium tulufanense TaxID=907463 RepID=A0A8J3CD31_9PSEU|nr:acyl carrier protein [Longimycelium tulufanense]GGM51049.1 hypothetical protein GCM10012275_22420 [Longimycelium tulufanense]
MSIEYAPLAADADVVLGEVAGMIREVLEEYEPEDLEIGMATRFGEDLEFESIDLVAMADHLNARYGEVVNFAEYLASMELDEIIELSVGQLVEYIVACLRAVEGG